jgi:hypothetical protein
VTSILGPTRGASLAVDDTTPIVLGPLPSTLSNHGTFLFCKHPVMLRSLEAFFPWALNVSATATIKAATSYINLLRLESPGGIALLFRQSPIIRANSASQCFRKSCSPGHGFSLRQQRSRLALRSTPIGQKGSWTGSLRRAVRSPDLAFADSAKGTNMASSGLGVCPGARGTFQPRDSERHLEDRVALREARMVQVGPAHVPLLLPGDSRRQESQLLYAT